MIIRFGFTLIELLVSIALGMTLTTAAIIAFRHTNNLSMRSEARIELHRTAHAIFERMQHDLGGRLSTGALWAENLSQTGRQPDPSAKFIVSQLIFLAATGDRMDFEIDSSNGPWNNHDVGWVRWVWDERTQRLLRGSHFRPYTFTMYATHANAGIDWKNAWFLLLAQPRRTANAPTQNDITVDPWIMNSSAVQRLSDNAWDQTSASSPSDWLALSTATVPMAHGVSDFRLDLVTDDPATSTISIGATLPLLRHAMNGVPVDGNPTEPKTNTTIYQPRLLRLRFTLTDTRTDLSIPFSFSFPFPGIIAN